jgi:hypothetical protein
LPNNEEPTQEKEPQDKKPTEQGNKIDFVARGQMLADKIVKQIEEAVDDVKALVVFTAAVHPDAQIENNLKGGVVNWDNLKAKVTAMASTRIEIDGDISAMIPAESNAPEIRQQLMELHRENLALAQQNVKRLLDTLLTFVEIGAKFAGIKGKDLQDLSKIKETIDHQATIPPATTTAQSTIPPATTTAQSTIPPATTTAQAASKSSSPK